MLATESAAPAPDWSLVAFRVPCPRCGHDLHGQSDPHCPACDLSFDWAIVVPLDRLTCPTCDYHLYGLQSQRCPECGNPFDWQEVLRGYQRRRKPLFEYHWRGHPLRNLWASWRLAMNPHRVWQLIEIHDPPAVGGLIALWVVTLGAFCLSLWALSHVGGWVLTAANLWSSGYRPTQGLLSWFGTVRGALASTSYGVWSWSAEACLARTAAIGLWSIVVFPGLLVLRQSMEQCHVKPAHVWRVCVYSTLPIVAAPFVYFTIALYIDLDLVAFGPRWQLRHQLAQYAISAIPFATWFYILVSVAWGYRQYIQMRHFAAVAITGHLLAFLAIMCVGIFPRCLMRFLI